MKTYTAQLIHKQIVCGTRYLTGIEEYCFKVDAKGNELFSVKYLNGAREQYPVASFISISIK